MQKVCSCLLVFALCPLVLGQTQNQNKDKNSKGKSKTQSTATTPAPATAPSSATSLIPEEQRRLEEAVTLLKEVLNIPDYIPQSLLNKAECGLAFTSVRKFAIGISGRSRHRVLTCPPVDKFQC